MIAGIMQPYFIPYIGYWQLISHVDVFVILDNVNYSRGWINRNRIRAGSSSTWLTIPLKRPSQNRLIREHDVVGDSKWRDDHERMIAHVLADQPFIDDSLRTYRHGTSLATCQLVEVLVHSLKSVMDYLSIDTTVILASDMECKDHTGRQDRIVQICREVGADIYYNLSGGRDIYDTENFKSHGVNLEFAEYDPTVNGLFPKDQIAHPGSIIQLIASYGLQYVSRALEKTL